MLMYQNGTMFCCVFRYFCWFILQIQMSFFKGIFFLHVPPSRVSRFPRSPRACLHSSEKCEIIIPVLQPISSPQKCRLLVLKKKNPFYSEENQRLNLSLCFAPSSSFEIVPFFSYLRFSLYISMLALRRSIWTG